MKYAILAALSLAACTPPQNTAAVYALASSLTAADIAALAYMERPACGPRAPPVCSDPALKPRIKQAAMSAYVAVKSAEASAAAGGSTGLIAAQSAVATYLAVIPPPVN